MMPILYQPGETEFNTNGLGALSDAISCTVTEERNGIFELEMEYPISGIRYADVSGRSLILAKPNPTGEPQPFRVYRITRPIGGIVTIYAQHISYDLSGVPVSPFTADNAVAAMAALGSMAAVESPFTFSTDKSTVAKMTVSAPSSTRSLLGGQEGSILDVYGGEYEFDRFAVKLLNQRGQNRGVSIRYGKNLTDLTQDENISNVYTVVYPYWSDTEGNLVTLPEKTLNAPGTYDFTRIMPLDLSQDFGEPPTEDQLKSKAQAYMKSNSIGVPTVSLTVSFAQLEQTEEYKNTALLERVELCDTVNVEFAALGVSATAKCIKTVYNVLLDRFESVELGDAKTNIADTIASQSQEIGQKPSITAMQQAINQLTNVILGAHGGSVRLLDTNHDGEPDTLYIADNPDPAEAVKVWRFNYEGWGASSNGYNGPFQMGASLNSGIVADFITTGTLLANLIKTGRIQSKTGEVYFDLDANGGKGELAASVLKGVDSGISTIAKIGSGTWAGGAEYQGLDLYYPGNHTGHLLVSINGTSDQFTEANNVQLYASGNLAFIANNHGDYSGGGNILDFIGDSTTGEGTIILKRGKSNDGIQEVLKADSERLWLASNDEEYIHMLDDTMIIYHKNRIEFSTNGYARVSIEPSGDLKAQDIYSNGILVTSDRKKKTTLKRLQTGALGKVNASPVYSYRLKREAASTNGNPVSDASDNESIGLVFDEAPREIRRTGSGGDTIDLYGMCALLWKAVQELSERLERLEAIQ